MVRVYQDKNATQPSIKKFIIEENFITIGSGTMSFTDGNIIISCAKVDDGLPFKYYDLLIRSMLHSVRDMGDIEIRVFCGHCEEQGYEAIILFEKLGFVREDNFFIVRAKDINFKGSCNG